MLLRGAIVAVLGFAWAVAGASDKGNGLCHCEEEPCFCLMGTTWREEYNSSRSYGNMEALDGAAGLGCGLFLPVLSGVAYDAFCDHSSLFRLEEGGSVAAGATSQFPDLPAEEDGPTLLDCSCRVTDAAALAAFLGQSARLGFNFSGFDETNLECTIEREGPEDYEDGSTGEFQSQSYDEALGGYYKQLNEQYFTGFSVTLTGMRNHKAKSVMPYSADTCVIRPILQPRPLENGEVFDQIFYINPGARLSALLLPLAFLLFEALAF
mmetsp:Transcript_31571/g.102893  ORF Transcript_31571/g.102893 Transcript_31571/m.102893 type:complete len:266 (-) Transcript_31571:76-873(-)